MRLLILLALVLPGGLQPAARAGSTPPEFAKIREFIQKAVDEQLTPSVAVVVIKEGALVWPEGDAKLKAYLGSADDMTVRRLANHTAGLSTHYNFFSCASR